MGIWSVDVLDILLVLRLFLLFFFGFLIVDSDLKTNKIPDQITYPLIIAGIIFNYIQFGISIYLVYSYLILLGTYFLFVVIYQILKLINSVQTIGGGDVKYSLAIASLIPFSPFIIGNIFILKVLFISVILIFIMAATKLVALLVINKLPQKSQLIINSTIISTKVAFAPILFISTVISMFV